MLLIGGCGSGCRARCPLIARLAVRSMRQGVLGQNTQPQNARDGQASIVRGSLLPLVCKCVHEWENEKQIVKHFGKSTV